MLQLSHLFNTQKVLDTIFNGANQGHCFPKVVQKTFVGPRKLSFDQQFLFIQHLAWFCPDAAP